MKIAPNIDRQKLTQKDPPDDSPSKMPEVDYLEIAMQQRDTKEDLAEPTSGLNNQPTVNLETCIKIY